VSLPLLTGIKFMVACNSIFTITWFNILQHFSQTFQFFYFKAENLVLRARSESVGFAEIVNKDRMVGINAFVP